MSSQKISDNPLYKIIISNFSIKIHNLIDKAIQFLFFIKIYILFHKYTFHINNINIKTIKTYTKMQTRFFLKKEIGKYFSLFSNKNLVHLLHIIPHTHDDAGWLWTLEQYYSGTGGASVSVKNILDNFVDSLYHNKERTFTYVEMAFFTKWYKSQTELVKSKVKQLIKEKRFEFINGGYVMHDEATSYYQHTIDQMRLGLLFLKQEFNYVPEVAWFIDPFGNSASNAYILSKMGFKKIVLVRIDYKEKDVRKSQKTLEFFWVPFGQIDESTKIFTHITHDHYNPPAGLEDFISDKDLYLSEYEISRRAEKLLGSIKDINSKYRHNHHLLMYGDDFTHNKADLNYLNIEKLMKYVNSANLGMKIVYSTPSRYFESIFKRVEEWPKYKNQDFFPYADGEYAYWTGYFTSRPYLKGIIREAGNYLANVSNELFEVISNLKILETNNSKNNSSNVEKKLIAVSNLVNSNIEDLFSLREYLAVCQHHDAVSGTARELVSQDYIRMLSSSIKSSKLRLNILMEEYLNVKNFNFCMDPVVDFICVQNIYNFDLDKNVTLKINNGKNFFSENILRSFDINSDHQIKSKKNLEGKINDEVEIFSVDALKEKTSNCKVYFFKQFDFVVSESN